MNIDTITYLFLGVIVFILLIIVLVKGCSNSENYTPNSCSTSTDINCSILPYGAIMSVFPGSDIVKKAIDGDGYLLCNGQWIDPANYKSIDLSEKLQTGEDSIYYDSKNPDDIDKYILNKESDAFEKEKDGARSTYVKIPNLNGRFLLGTNNLQDDKDNGTVYGGSATIEANQLPPHAHDYAGIYKAQGMADDSGRPLLPKTPNWDALTDGDIYRTDDSCNTIRSIGHNYCGAGSDPGKQQCNSCCMKDGCQAATYDDDTNTWTVKTTTPVAKISQSPIKEYNPPYLNILYVMYVGSKSSS